MLEFVRKDIARQETEFNTMLEECEKVDDAYIICKNVLYHEQYGFDLYGKTKEEKQPIIIEFHGGGLVMCDKSASAHLSCNLAKLGYLVFNVDYPLIHSHDLYEIIQCISHILPLVKQYGEVYHGDLDSIYLCGDSAGAMLAIYLAAIINNPKIAKYFNAVSPFTKVKGLGLISGMYYCGKFDRHGMFVLRKDFFRRHNLKPYRPIDTFVDDLPPITMITSANDYLRDYTYKFEKVLKQKDHPYILMDDPRPLEHDFVAFKPTSLEAKEAIEYIVHSFKKVEN